MVDERGRSRDPLRDGFALVSAAYVLGIAAGIVPYGTDHVAYWHARMPDPYGASFVGGPDAFLYSPAFAQILGPVTGALSEPMFVALWTASLLGILFLVTGRWAGLVLLVPGVAFEVFAGNIHIMLLAVTVFGFRWPVLWSFALLTKVAPGIGLLWFVVRREWWSLAVILVVTAGIATVSWALDPNLWSQWLALLADSTDTPVTYAHVPIPLVVRLPIAAAIVSWGALTNRRWVVPVASMLALPVIWPGGFSLLVGAVALYLADRDPATGGTPSRLRPPRWPRRTG